MQGEALTRLEDELSLRSGQGIFMEEYNRRLTKYTMELNQEYSVPLESE